MQVYRCKPIRRVIYASSLHAVTFHALSAPSAHRILSRSLRASGMPNASVVALQRCATTLGDSAMAELGVNCGLSVSVCLAAYVRGDGRLVEKGGW